jgi:drug/metabolite transporter (DMT)-like permease
VNFKEFLLLLGSVLGGAAGQYFLKLGAAKLGQATGGDLVAKVLGIITIPELLMGLSCYALGAILYILLLTRVSLSVAGPSASLVYVFSVLLGVLVFKEALPLTRITGLGFIVAGVILVVWRKG